MKDKICPKCQGNGYVKIKESVERSRVELVHQCTLCNSEGEVYDKEFDDYFDSHPLLKSVRRNKYH